jgi:hypothetical protein
MIQTASATGILPAITGRVRTLVAVFLIAGPGSVLVAAVVNALASDQPVSAAIDQVAVPLMLGWAATLFLLTRTEAPVLATVGLVAMTVELTTLSGHAAPSLVLATELVGFGAFALALHRTWWVPRIVPWLMIAFPVIDMWTPEHANPVQVLSFALFTMSFVAVAVRLPNYGLAAPTLEPADPLDYPTHISRHDPLRQSPVHDPLRRDLRHQVPRGIC